MEKQAIRLESLSVTENDYHEALLYLYRKYTEELRRSEGNYRDWAQTADVYAMSKVDGSGRPIPANVKAFNETVIERRKLSIVIKFLRNEIDFLEKFWVSRGFDLKELKNSVQQKTLLKTSPIKLKEEPKKQEEQKKPEEQKNPHKILINS
jgi:hypothetical protein